MKVNTRSFFEVKNSHIIKVLLLALFCVLAFSLNPLSSAQAATWYVDVGNVSGTYNGLSWDTAYQTI
ncbi:MAG: hypothetical protein JSV50_16075, partial [Desulfobacteraceae bacterium]